MKILIIEDDTMKYGEKGLIASNIEQLKLQPE